MFAHLRRAVVVSIILFVVCGLAYPFAVTGVAQLTLRGQADGSLVTDGHTVIGSRLIGQQWKGPRWFQGRPDGDDPMESGSQNFGPKSKLLLDFARQQVAALEREGITPTNDLVTGSGSGIDPDISAADAAAQVHAVAHANGLSVAAVRALVKSEEHGAELGFLGAPYIDVLQLNQALAALVQRDKR